ncbi:MAG: ATP-dependent RecD-like DNA helicase [bacterium]|nr:ATP-dependent RecD-like DNA helicase [bacterium]
MATVSGFVEKIKFRNSDNGYTVLTLASEGEEYVLVGSFQDISEGEMLEAEGTLSEHPMYGEQFLVESYQIKMPEDTAAMERYLGSGAIKGVGMALASRIVRKFKKDTFRVIEQEPERLAEVKGISDKMARAIAEQLSEKREMRQAMMFLQDYGISMSLAVKIYNEYGAELYRIIKENPYQMADDIVGVGFRIADEIAGKIGILMDSDYRIRSGILYALLQAVANGHTYLPKSELLQQAEELLRVEASHIELQLGDMMIDKKLVIKEMNGIQAVYAAQYYYMELNTAKMLHDLNLSGTASKDEMRKSLAAIQKEENITLDALQEEAVMEAMNHGLLIITGGPGTGKTTTITTMIRYFEQEDMEILLAAPTGRAAKRMTEATGYEARTIHRLLELNGLPDEKEGSRGMRFERNEENPLEADAIIIDEVSMVDIHLMHALLKAINPGTRLILVGDVDQLPSVGPGNVLRDLIESECFPVVKLTHIFRQATQSDIIVNAHAINRGEAIPLGKRSRDFLFIRQEEADAIIQTAITLVKDKLPPYVHAEPFEIQVMTPMRRGVLGVERLNTVMQKFLNPPSEQKREKAVGELIFREGDKVMQIKNNYQMEWEIRNRYGIVSEKGSGIFNGDMGRIQEINLFAETVTVLFDESRWVEYSFKQLEELELAYAITIHKSQGSEYPAVVIPVYHGPKMLMNRNLIYTAVTRAKTCVCLVGLPQLFQAMVDNATEQKRYSGLKERIQEITLL